MAIQKLIEFAKTGQKDKDQLDIETGFIVNRKPARQWFNWLFNTLTVKINEIIDADFIPKNNIVDNLTTDDATKPVSAKQAKRLQDEKLSKASNLSDLQNAAAARTNLGLGNAATRNVVRFSDDSTAGSLLDYGAFGIGRGIYIDNTYNLNTLGINALWCSSLSPMNGWGNGIFQTFRGHLNRYAQIGFTQEGLFRYRAGLDYTGAGAWSTILASNNTTTDSNGFIKAASPIVQLFSNKIELNDEAQQQSIEFEKLGTGDYLLKNSTGLSNDGWYVEQPRDANGNLYHAVLYEQLENGDISVKTFEQKLDGTRIVADHSKPVDIKENRFISIRLNELPQDVTAPINPIIKDDDGNTAPSKYHVLEDGVWTISSDDELRMAQEKRALFAKLSKRQFALYMYDNNMYDQVMQAIEANPRFKIEYDAVSDIERLSPTVSEMTSLLGWTEEQVDQMWAEALTL